MLSNLAILGDFHARAVSYTHGGKVDRLASGEADLILPPIRSDGQIPISQGRP